MDEKKPEKNDIPEEELENVDGGAFGPGSSSFVLCIVCGTRYPRYLPHTCPKA